MGQPVQVDTKRPLRVAKEDGEITTVKNIGKPTVYYKTGQNGESVSSSLNDSSLAEGKSLTLNQTTFFAATEAAAELEITTKPRRSQETLVTISYEAPAYPQQFGATGNGVTDDTKAVQEAITASHERVCAIPPGKYQITSPLELPDSTVLEGANQRTSVLEAEGEIDLIRVKGSDTAISNVFLKAKTAQASAGSAIDFSHGFTSDFYGSDIRLGSNFFNGLYMVGETAEIGGLKWRRLRFCEFNTSVKKYGNAAVVIGNTASAKRVAVVSMYEVHGQAAVKADMPKWFEINNADSVQITDCLMQTGLKGLVVGNADASSKKTTNLYAKAAIADACTVGYELANLFSGEMTGCHAETCGNGIVVSEAVSGLNVTGGSVYNCEGDGINVQASAKPKYALTLSGVTIAVNGQNKEAAKAGIVLAEKSGGLLVSGCTIGNPELVGTAEQKIGVLINKKCENVGLIGNRFFGNVTAAIKLETETVGIKSVVEMEAQNLMV